VKLLTYFQALGCELHKNALGRRASPGPADPLSVTRGGEGGKGKERVGNREEEGGEGKRGRGGGGGGRGVGVWGKRKGTEEKGREGSTWIFVEKPPISS